MWISATVNAFDAMSKVWVSANVRVRADGHEGESLAVHTFSTTVDGVGETDPETWLRDALVALLETL